MIMYYTRSQRQRCFVNYIFKLLQKATASTIDYQSGGLKVVGRVNTLEQQ